MRGLVARALKAGPIYTRDWRRRQHHGPPPPCPQPPTHPLSLPRENLFVKQLKNHQDFWILTRMNILSILCILAKIKTVLSRVLRGGVARNLIPSPVDTISLRHFLPPSPCSGPDDNFNMPGQFFVLILLALLYRIASPLLRILNIYYIEH